MQSDFICWFLLVLFIGVFADIRTVEKGRPVLLFENFEGKTVKEVNVRVNGVEDPTLVVTFTFVNESIIMDWNAAEEDNYGNIYMDPKRNIWIAEMDKNYEKKFYIDSSKGDSSKILLEVELTISKTNYSTTVRTPLNENTQKGDVLPVYAYVLIILGSITILMLIIMMPMICKNAWIQCKKSNSVPQQVQITSPRDSPYSTLYKLTWVKPDDGGSPLIKYNIQYCEVEIIPGRTEYELSKYLKPFQSVDNVLPSDVSCNLSPLTSGIYYLVEIQAIHTQGQTLKSFIFKTKEMEHFSSPVEEDAHSTEDETKPTCSKLSGIDKMEDPREIVANADEDIPMITIENP